MCGWEKKEIYDPNNPAHAIGNINFGTGYGKGVGKAGKSVAPIPGPYGKADAKGRKDGKSNGIMCRMQEFVEELIAGGLPGGGHDPTVNCIYVGGLPKDTKNENLYHIFATFGAIPPKGTTIEAAPSGECVGWGLVNFIESTSADMAVMALNGIETNEGGKLEVRRK
jgi:hypothetical protein